MTNRSEFAFGLVADIQYACKDDKHSEGRCQRYREVPSKLTEAVDHWQKSPCDLEFVLSLGDIIDGMPTLEETDTDYYCILQILQPLRLSVDFCHVLGNHCLSVSRARLLQDLRMPSSYYSKQLPGGWRLVALDTTEISGHSCYPADSELGQEASAYIQQHPLSEQEPHMVSWNGGIGKRQFAWLADQLQQASTDNQRVIIACHHQLGLGAARATHMAWNWREIEALLLNSPCVRLVLSGHDHMGGYVQKQHLHFVTLEAMLEAPHNSNAYAVVEVKQHQITIQGRGSVTTRQLSV